MYISMLGKGTWLILVAVSVSGTNRVMTSPNGITWTGRVSSDEHNMWNSVCWAKELGLLVAVALDSN